MLELINLYMGGKFESERQICTGVRTHMHACRHAGMYTYMRQGCQPCQGFVFMHMYICATRVSASTLVPRT